MDDSMSSTNYMSQSLSSEESGWTLYFEDFLANNNYDNMDNIQEEVEEHTSFSSSANYPAIKKLGDRKMISKTRKIHAKMFVDEELEDTASSPSHSPKVNNDLNHLYSKMKSKELDTTMDSQDACQAYNSGHFQSEQTNIKETYTSLSQEKGQVSLHAGDGIDMDFLQTQLRKKGLCLVPMSMLFKSH